MKGVALAVTFSAAFLVLVARRRRRRQRGQIVSIHCHNLLAMTWVEGTFGEENAKRWYGDAAWENGLLDATRRHQLSLDAAHASGADFICLQEVGAHELLALRRHKLSEGYLVLWVPNASTCGHEPNGVATLVRKGMELVEHVALQLNGEVGASCVRCRCSDDIGVSVLNVHLSAGSTNLSEACEAVDALERVAASHSPRGDPPRAMFMCGDFNATPDSEALQMLRNRCGFVDGFDFVDTPSFAKLPTGVGGTRIDYMLYKDGRAVHAIPPKATSAARRGALGTSDLSELLQAVGSDHTPLAASFEIRHHL